MSSRSIDTALKIAEKQEEREVNSKISARMRAGARDSGPVDGFRAVVLAHVAGENYARALEDLQICLESKSEYPQFAIRTERYLNYCSDLINAIKVKRSFPGISQLSMSKQQELFDKAIAHFNDLHDTLKKIEQIDRQVRLEDVRSTVWVLKAVIYSVFAVLVLGFLLEISQGILPALAVVVDDTFGSLVNWVFDKIGF